MHGLPTIGTIGFGWFDVSGRSRVPSPPAITTAFTADLPKRLGNVLCRGDHGQRRGSPRRARAATRCHAP